MVNVNVIGRLGKDSEVKDGKKSKFLSLNVAVDCYDYSTKSNKTEWFNVMDSSERGINLAQYLKKGSMVTVFGKEDVSIYQDKDGNHRISRSIIADRIEFVNSGKRNGEETNTSTTEPVTAGVLKRNTQTVDDSADNDELPF
jgi:single-strand DNA-binding protein